MSKSFLTSCRKTIIPLNIRLDSEKVGTRAVQHAGEGSTLSVGEKVEPCLDYGSFFLGVPDESLRELERAKISFSSS